MHAGTPAGIVLAADGTWRGGPAGHVAGTDACLRGTDAARSGQDAPRAGRITPFCCTGRERCTQNVGLSGLHRQNSGCDRC